MRARFQTVRPWDPQTIPSRPPFHDKEGWRFPGVLELVPTSNSRGLFLEPGPAVSPLSGIVFSPGPTPLILFIHKFVSFCSKDHKELAVDFCLFIVDFWF